MLKSVFDKFMLVFFLASGVSALVYEIVWEKYMTLFLGAGAYSQAAVLSSFMFGLGLGNYVLGFIVEQCRDRLRLYGFLECAIGLYALFFPLLIRLGERFFIQFITVDTSSLVVLMTKFLISFVIMAIPSFFIGGTLPVVSKYLLTKISDAGRKLSYLYFINSFGAVIGCIATGFILIPRIGFDMSIYLAAGINIVIGLAVLVFKDRIGETEVEQTVIGPEPSPVSAASYAASIIVRFRVIAFLSGLTAMMYEVVWIRVLSNVLGTTTYSFSLMLAVFILGIALGSLAISIVIDRVKDVLTPLIIIEIVSLVSISLIFPLYNRLPYLFHILSNSLTHSPAMFYVFNVLASLLCAVVMLPFCTLSGMLLPLLGRGVLSELKNVGRQIGTLFAYNIFGTIIAALVTGLVILPAIGSMNTILLGLTINVLILLVLISCVKRGLITLSLGLGAVILTGLIGRTIPGLSPHVFLSSEYRHANHRNFSSFKDYLQYYQKVFRVLSFDEGVTSTITVTEEKNGNRALFINGKADASTSIDGDLITQTLLGLLPVVLAPQSKRVLIVGLGTGTTAHMSALPETVRRVDVVELSGGVVDVLPFFNAVNGHLNSNPKVKIYIEDAKTFMSLSQSRYDAIINEPSNPWIAGIGNLFTVEYYEKVAETLSDNGIFAQWLQTYETSDAIIFSVLSSLRQVFPYMDIWYCGRKDLVITCYKNRSFYTDIAATRAAFNRIKNEMTTAKINNFEEILLRHMANEAVIDRALQAEPAIENSDTFPYIEYEAPKQLFVQKETQLLNFLDQRLKQQKQSAFPFFALLGSQSPATYFTYFNNFHVKTPITLRMRKLEVMYSKAWFIDSPWTRKYYLDDLAVYYDGAKSKEKRSWYLRELHAEYRDLINCFVDVPFVPFLREKVEQYLAEYPEDSEMTKIYDDLLRVD